MDLLDRQACHRALQTRDARFDGRLFVGVTSTGINCRPICPARTAREENCRFFASAAAAQEAGFRPCLRCRPELAPDVGAWRGSSTSVSRALLLIADGALDGGDAGVEALAERVGLGGRQLRRLFEQHLGASPIAVAQTRRVLFAKQLLHDTRLPKTEVALAAGFGSVGRFNETFRRLFRRPPTELRRFPRSGGMLRAALEAGVTLRLCYRPPYDWAAMLAHTETRAITCVEQVEEGVYRRTVAHAGVLGTVEVRHQPARAGLAATIRFPSVRALTAILDSVRRLFDVGADIQTIGAHLSQDPFLAPLVAPAGPSRAGRLGGIRAGRAGHPRPADFASRGPPARRAAGGAVRAAPARESGAGRWAHPRLPYARQVAAADLGMPAARRVALRALAEAAIAQYIALRALREPDAFPASDLGLLRCAATGAIARATPVELLRRAEPWRPWRAYAAQHLWATDAGNLRTTAKDVR